MAFFSKICRLCPMLFLSQVFLVLQERSANLAWSCHQCRCVSCRCVRLRFTRTLTVHISFFTPTRYEEMPVLDWACTFLSKFSPGRRQRIQIQDLDRLDSGDVKLLKNVLKGVRVTVSVPAGRRPARPIKDLVPDVGGYQFMKGDEETTIRVRAIVVMIRISDRPRTFRSIMKKSTATGFDTRDHLAYASTCNKKPSFPRKFAPS